MQESIRQRLMLLTGARSYRAGAFHRAAEQLGVDVLPIVNMNQELADHWDHEQGFDFDDPHAAEAIAELARQRSVSAVLAVDDSGTLIAAKVAHLLGLPHNSPESAYAARDKHRMRQQMDAAGVPCPWFKHFSTADDFSDVAKQIPFPCVVKPLNLNGSRGVIRADNTDEFRAALQRLTRLLDDQSPGESVHPYLVESFIPGIEVALEGLLDNGRLIVLALFDKPDPLDGPFFEETIYVTPSRLSQTTQASIADTVGQAARSLGLQTGPIHAELRVNDQGPWMLEVAGRSIGGLCSQTLRFGIDGSLEELIVRQACGLPLHATQREDQASGVMMIPIPEAGLLRGVDGIDAAGDVPGVEGVEITAKINYSISPLPEGDSYLGFIFARGSRPEEVESTLRDAHARLVFDIAPEFTLLGN